MAITNPKSGTAPESLEALLVRARAAEASARPASAFQLFQLVLVLDPGRDSAAYRAALNLIDVGRLSDAEACLDRLRKPIPKPWLIELVSGELRMAQFKPVQAEKHFKRSCKLNPTSTIPAVFLADCLSKQEKFRKASRVLEKAIGARGDVDEVYLNLGILKRAQADYQASRRYLLKALKLSPQYAQAKEVLADVEECLALKNQTAAVLDSTGTTKRGSLRRR